MASFDFISVYLNTIEHLNFKLLMLIGILQVLRFDHLNFKLLMFIGILQVLRFDFQKFRIFEILTFTHVNMVISILMHLCACLWFF